MIALQHCTWPNIDGIGNKGLLCATGSDNCSLRRALRVSEIEGVDPHGEHQALDLWEHIRASRDDVNTIPLIAMGRPACSCFAAGGAGHSGVKCFPSDCAFKG